MKKSEVRAITRAGAIAALYVALTYLSFLVGLSSGAIQLRLSEMLCVLPALIPEAAVALYIGCLLANLLTGGSILDILLGSLATLIGAFFARRLRKTEKPMLIALPTVIANALIVPLVIILSAGSEQTLAAFPYLALTVGIGEFLSAAVLGTLLYKIIKKHNLFKEL